MDERLILSKDMIQAAMRRKVVPPSPLLHASPLVQEDKEEQTHNPAPVNAPSPSDLETCVRVLEHLLACPDDLFAPGYVRMASLGRRLFRDIVPSYKQKLAYSIKLQKKTSAKTRPSGMRVPCLLQCFLRSYDLPLYFSRGTR
eukprot:TRINITY_DN32569_c0_g1_i1.p1 TRINITY_DN32569_c0_g1~~TRINITY_DN32569_c0_g1_i1.p1  ORF type:complete len:143 (-),score=33.31 TRINITY_DN32569_c0_g1_i1:1-429(-)